MKQHSDKYAWAGRTAIIYNIFVDDFFEKIEYKNTTYYSYATILYDYYLKDKYKLYKSEALEDIGFQYMEVNNPNSLKVYSIKGDEFPEYEHAIVSKTTDKMTKDNVVYQRGPKSANDFIFPCKVLVTGLKPATEYTFKRYYVINNEFKFDNEITISTSEDSQNSVSCLGFNFDSSVTENEKKIFELGIQDACNIMNMMSIFDFHFIAKTQNAKGASWAANSSMTYNSLHSSTWKRENLRTTTLHELAHNFLDEDFKGSDVTEFMEFATGIPNATWKWMNIHNYPVISSRNYDYIGDCLVAAACLLAPKIKIPDRPVDTRAVDLGLPSGLLWSSYNLGAENENESGKLFAWADPSGKSYNQSTYTNVVEASIDDISSTKYDIATMTLGNGWHMPNKLDFEELREECEWTYITTPFVGWKVTGPNNNSILLPMCGDRQGDGRIARNGTAAFYWTSTNYSGLEAVYYTFSTSAKIAGRTAHSSKYIGMNVRPVKGNSNVPISDEDDKNPSPYDNAAVDLGLSVDWASYNIGATKATEAGNKYAWGETEIKDSCTPNNYEYYDYDAGTYISLGLDDISGSEYDPVHLLWGGDWQMPTNLEIMELISECNWSWDKINGVDGFTITSKLNGNSIFLPVTEDNEGSYWSSTLYTLSGPFYNNSAYYLNFSENYTPTGCLYYYRYIGRCIRPVKIKR